METMDREANAWGLIQRALDQQEELVPVHRALILMDAAKELLIAQREKGGPDGRSLSVAITHIETGQLWANEAMAGPGEGVL